MNGRTSVSLGHPVDDPTSITYGNGLTENRTYSLKGELTNQTLRIKNQRIKGSE